MKKAGIVRAKIVLGVAFVALLGGCQRADEKVVEANMGGNQALSQNLNESEVALPPTANQSLNAIAPNAADQYSNSSDSIPQTKKK